MEDGRPRPSAKLAAAGSRFFVSPFLCVPLCPEPALSEAEGWFRSLTLPATRQKVRAPHLTTPHRFEITALPTPLAIQSALEAFLTIRHGGPDGTRVWFHHYCHHHRRSIPVKFNQDSRRV